MADKDITIGIGTTGDPSGAKVVTEALDKVSGAARDVAASNDEIDQSKVVIRDYAAEANKAREAMEKTVRPARDYGNALDQIEEQAREAGRAVVAMREAAERQAPLTELQKLEFELQQIEAEAKALDATLAKLQSRGQARGNFGINLQSQIERRETQGDMLRPQIEALRATEAAAAASAKASAEAAEKSRIATEATKKQAAAAKELLREEREIEAAARARDTRNRVIAAGVAFAAERLRGATQSLRELAEANRGVDDALADSMENIATGFEGIQRGVQSAAIGFAAGGPVGAIVGGLLGLTAAPLRTGIDDLVKSLNNLAEAKAIGDDMANRIQKVKSALLVEQQAASWKALSENVRLANAELDAAQKIAAEIERAEIAKAKANEALVAAEGGDVAGAAAATREAERAARVAEINRQLESAEAAARAAEERFRGKVGEMLGVQEQDARNPEVEKLRAEVAQLRAAMEDAARELETAREIFTIRMDTESAVSGTGDRTRDAEERNAQEQKQIETLVELGSGLEGNKELAHLAESIGEAIEDGKLTAAEMDKIAGGIMSSQRQIGDMGKEFLNFANDVKDILNRQSAELRAVKAQLPHMR